MPGSTDGGPEPLILDGARYALRAVGEGAPDLAAVLAEWFLERADAGGSLWLRTLTFDPVRLLRNRADSPHRQPPSGTRDRVGHRGAIDALTADYEILQAFMPGADVLAGVEAHKSGARHAHELVAAPPPPYGAWGRVAAHWYEAHGFNRWDRVARATAAARYAAKYVGKELGVWGVAFDGGSLVVV